MRAKSLVQNINSLVKEAKSPEIESILERMLITPKQRQTAFRDELSSLINNYEIDGVEIGLIVFFGEYKVTDNYMLFGTVDMDFLGISREKREIVLLDHDNQDYIMLKCTKDSTAFLNVLNIYAEFVIKKLKKVKQGKDLNMIYDIAGGSDYKKFIDYLFS